MDLPFGAVFLFKIFTHQTQQRPEDCPPDLGCGITGPPQVLCKCCNRKSIVIARRIAVFSSKSALTAGLFFRYDRAIGIPARNSPTVLAIGECAAQNAAIDKAITLQKAKLHRK